MLTHDETNTIISSKWCIKAKKALLMCKIHQPHPTHNLYAKNKLAFVMQKIATFLYVCHFYNRFKRRHLSGHHSKLNYFLLIYLKIM